jgi:hypothetical protein
MWKKWGILLMNCKFGFKKNRIEVTNERTINIIDK